MKTFWIFSVAFVFWFCSGPVRSRSGNVEVLTRPGILASRVKGDVPAVHRVNWKYSQSHQVFFFFLWLFMACLGTPRIPWWSWEDWEKSEKPDTWVPNGRVSVSRHWGPSWGFGEAQGGTSGTLGAKERHNLTGSIGWMWHRGSLWWVLRIWAVQGGDWKQKMSLSNWWTPEWPRLLSLLLFLSCVLSCALLACVRVTWGEFYGLVSFSRSLSLNVFSEPVIGALGS